jgi:hypothetical protein
MGLKWTHKQKFKMKNATPKMGVHLGIIGFHPLHFPICESVFHTQTHYLGLMCPLHSTFDCEPNVKVVKPRVLLWFEKNSTLL